MTQIMTARDLARDLAMHLREKGWLAYTEIEIPGTGGRVDVAAVLPHRYAGKALHAYEIKISRGDFHRDVMANKWMSYLQVFHRLYFAAPAGLLKADEIPTGAGLITRSENGWHVVKSPRTNSHPPNLDADAVLALLYRGYEEDREMRRLRDRIVAEENMALKYRAKTIGHEIRRRLAGANEGIEEWAMTVLQICREITGRTYDMSTWEGRDKFQRDLERVERLVKYAKLLEQIGEFFQTPSWGWARNEFRKLHELSKHLADEVINENL